MVGLYKLLLATRIKIYEWMNFQDSGSGLKLLLSNINIKITYSIFYVLYIHYVIVQIILSGK